MIRRALPALGRRGRCGSPAAAVRPGRAGDLADQSSRGLSGHQQRQLRRAAGLSALPLRRWNAPREVPDPLHAGRHPDRQLHLHRSKRTRGRQHVVPDRRHRRGRKPSASPPDITDSQMEHRSGRRAPPAGTSATRRSTAPSWGDFTGQADARVPTPGSVSGTPPRRGGSRPARRSNGRSPPTARPGSRRRRHRRQRHRLLRGRTESAERRALRPRGIAMLRIRDAGRHRDRTEAERPVADSDAHFTYAATGATSYQCKLDSCPRFTTCPERRPGLLRPRRRSATPSRCGP